MITGSESVIQRLKLDPLMGGLALGPLMAVQVDPYRVWGVRVGLDERRPPVRIEDVLVVVVDEHGLAIELEMRVRVTPAIAPTAPRERLLLRDAEHHHPRTPVPLSLLHVRARDVLLDHVLGEPHHRDLPRLRERVDVLHVGAADLPEQHRRRDRPARMVVEEPHQLPVALQPRDVPREQDPVDRTHPQRDVIGE